MRKCKQKLSGKLKNTPTDTSLVCGSGNCSLNKEETLSVSNIMLSDNNPEENQQHIAGRDLRVPVLNMRGKPLMPTTPAKARRMLKEKKAKVVCRKPFVIQLLMASGETKQQITLGIDEGYKCIGFSVTTDKKELMSGEVNLRSDVSKKLIERKMYRRGRRNKLWYRKPRFLNRKKKDGWLPPSLQNKYDVHIRLINNLRGWLPITKTIIEVASFDTQKMANPEISGIEYQQGELMGYMVREYLLEKFNRRCVYCGKSGVSLEVEHIVPKSKGGSNKVSNLTISCRSCNLRKGSQNAVEFGFPNIQKQANVSLKSTVFMNVLRGRVVKDVGADETFGFITKHNRILWGLKKSHINDAFVIAGGSEEKRCKPFVVVQVRRNNRCLQVNRVGFKPSVRRRRYAFQPNDVVRCNNRIQKVKGVFNYGMWVRLGDNMNTNIKNIMLIKYGKGLYFN